MPNVLNYFNDSKTHEFTKSAPAQLHPRTGEPLPALLAVHVAPPETGEKEKAVWNGEAWEVIEDHRQHTNEQGVKEGGTGYWLPGDTRHSAARYMEDLGPLPEGARLTPPPPSLTETASAKRREIVRGYEEAIVATMTMPSASPGQGEIAAQAALFAAEDAEGLSDVLALLAARRAELEAEVARIEEEFEASPQAEAGNDEEREAAAVAAVNAIEVTYPL